MLDSVEELGAAVLHPIGSTFCSMVDSLSEEVPVIFLAEELLVAVLTDEVLVPTSQFLLERVLS